MDASLNTLVGREVAGFRLTARLGEGGMAMVFRGENTLDPSIVRAIKVVFPHLSAQPEFVKRFSLEARVLDQLQHPNIVRFHGLRQAQVEGSALLVMELELLEGQSLSALVNPNPPIAQAVDWVRQASEGVAAAHALGVVHRDLKPDNLLLTRSGQIKVLDFGIARVMDDVRRHTQVTTAGVVPGTPGYMAPEVCSGALPTAAADVYALGLTLYEMLLGRHPFVEPGQPPQSGLQMMFAHVQRQLPPLRSLRADAPEVLETILTCATAKDPAQRFSDANALATALRMAHKSVAVLTSAPPMSVRLSSNPALPAATSFQLPILGDASVGGAITPSVPSPDQHNNGAPQLTGFQLPFGPTSGGVGAQFALPSSGPTRLPIPPSPKALAERTAGRQFKTLSIVLFAVGAATALTFSIMLGVASMRDRNNALAQERSTAMEAAATEAAAAQTHAAASPSCSGCCYQSHSAFHLRPTEAVSREGAEEITWNPMLQVLRIGSLSRGSEWMFNVRMLPDGREGWVFIPVREIPPGCPMPPSDPL